MIRTSVVLSISIAYLTGCASQFQAVKAFNTSADVASASAEDIYSDDIKRALCKMTVTTLVAHPELGTAVKSICVKTSAGDPSIADVVNSLAPIPTILQSVPISPINPTAK